MLANAGLDSFFADREMTDEEKKNTSILNNLS